MAENLNFNAKGSKCYENKDANCKKYGRLYNWETAGNSCPKGWHLPNHTEWITLADFVDGESIAGYQLKAKEGWNGNGNGTDTYGFAALPGGAGLSDGGFIDAGSYGLWWSASENNAGYAYLRNMGYNYEGAYWNYGSKTYLFSVRCLQD